MTHRLWKVAQDGGEGSGYQVHYLNDIGEAADQIAEFIAGVDFQAFQGSEMLRKRSRPEAGRDRRSGRACINGPDESSS